MPPERERPLWDVFLSYSRDDAAPALALGRALRDGGLRVYWDAHGVGEFQPVSRTILDELGRSRVLLAYYSTAYPARRACQHELTAAFLAGQRAGDPCRRVLVVNPEPGGGHIHPVELRDARHSPAPRGRRALAALVDQVTRHVATVDGPLGAVEPATPPLWLPAPARTGGGPFVGRLPELWRLHSALHRHRAPLTAPAGGRVAVVHGLGGIGKSTLVEEYAHRFAAAFPGGVFWLDGRDGGLAGLRRTLRTLACTLSRGPVAPEHAVDALAAVLHRRGEPCLWVLDDVPAGPPPDGLAGLLGPHLLARSIVVTRDRRCADLGTGVEIGGLPEADARELFPSTGDDGPDAVGEVVRALDGHPLALRRLAARSDVAEVLDALYDGRCAGLGALTARLGVDLSALDGTSGDLLRGLAALHPGSVPVAALADMATRSGRVSADRAPALVRARLRELVTASLVRLDGRTAAVPGLVSHLVRAHDPDRRRHARVRALLLEAALRPAVGAESGGSGTGAGFGVGAGSTGRPPGYSATERHAAWRLQVELAHRIGVVALPAGEGCLREALSSLYAMFGATRDLLRSVGPPHSGPPQPSLVSSCAALLERHLRPLLQRWHPALLAHEARRPAGADPVEHERAWRHDGDLRAALSALHDPLHGLLSDLSVITGSTYGLRGTIPC